MFKDVIFGDNARERMLIGVNVLGDAVSSTIGPKGRNAIIEQGNGQPLITNDGVTIAKSIRLPNAYENMGAMLVAQAAAKTNDLAGDGTTTATVLTQAMINKGDEALKTGLNPVDLRNGIHATANYVVEELSKVAKQIDTNDEIAQVASVSAADENIGQLIANAMSKVGKDGVITMEESRGINTELLVTEGMEYDRGYISPYFVIDNQRMRTQLIEPLILITSHKLSHINPLIPLLEQVFESGRPLLIIADDVEGEVLNTLVQNVLARQIHCMVIKSPGFGDRRKEILEDIAVATGGKFIDADLAQGFDDIKLEDLGTAAKTVTTKTSTTIVEPGGYTDDINHRISVIQAQLESAKTEIDERHFQERLAKLAGGVAVIKVGAATETEMRERKMRIEDALNATKAAVKEGIVAGGGHELFKIALAKDANNFVSSLSNDGEITGGNIVLEAMIEPFHKIIRNAGYSTQSIVDEAIAKGLGFNSKTGEYVDLITDGVIDPVTVTKSALQNAASIASMYLTTEVAISNIKEVEASNGDMTIPLGALTQMK